MDTISSSFFVILFIGINCSPSDILHRQKRTWIIDSFKIEEEYSGTFPYVLGKIDLENDFTFQSLHGYGVDKEPRGLLSINNASGVISVHSKVDYETYQKLMLKFVAHDGHDLSVIDTELSLEVQILDINDNVPTFEWTNYPVTLKESAAQGSYVLVLRATDKDSGSTKNGTFVMRIVSVIPEPSGVEFFMEQKGQYGNISFRGCLDYEKAKSYTILVEVKDQGEKVQLSSTCTVVINIEDENNNLPFFTGSPEEAHMDEREVDVEISRMQATDRDAKGTDAWKVKYIIHGKSVDSFRIDTNPETNEGVLYVTKPLDYEDQTVLNLTISVENYGNYFSCKVVSKTGPNNLWGVVRTTEKDQPSTVIVIVNLSDVNDAPIFKPNEPVRVYEDIDIGTNLATMTATDRDVAHGNKIYYAKGEDRGDWVAVDRNTGVVTTVNTLDRESPLVINNTYIVTVLAVDDGKPPATGTGTLSIIIRDRNDNVPQLDKSSFGMCVFNNDTQSQVNLTASDRDEVPFAGPFHFKLLGDVKNKWRIDPDHGFSVNLIREDTVQVGFHEVTLEVSDQQAKFVQYNLSVLVCECKVEMGGSIDCLARQSSSSIGFSRVSPILFIAILLLLGILLLSLLLSCKRQVLLMPDEGTEQNLIPSNTEQPGSDCKMALKTLHQEREDTIQRTHVQDISHQFQAANSEIDGFPKSNFQTSYLGTRNGLRTTNSFIRSAHNGLTRTNSSMRRTQNGFRSTNTAWDGEDYVVHRKFLQQFLERRFTILEAPGEELGDYAPHLYAEEGHPESSPQLDPIPIQEIPFHPDMLHLDSQFNTLASLCSPIDTSS